MRNFDYRNTPATLLTAEIVALVGQARELKGRQELFAEASPDVLRALVDVARIQSTESSNRIEGIFTSGQRLKELVENRVEPRNRSEEEIAGYRDVLATIHEHYQHIRLTPNVVLQLHRDLYAFSRPGFGGRYKASDNVIAEVRQDGTEAVRFRPVKAFETKQAMEGLCESFNRAVSQQVYDPLILISMFVLDFLCIHPFSDGNGRMSRLLTLLLLYQSGYEVGKYISLEMLIEQTKETYYDALQASSLNWHEQENAYEYFARYTIGIVNKAYGEFENRVAHLRQGKHSKADRVLALVEQSLKPVSKQDLLALAPDISQVTVERALKNLQDRGLIRKVGQGRATKYVKR